MPEGFRVIFYGSHSASFQPCRGSHDGSRMSLPRMASVERVLLYHMLASPAGCFLSSPSLRSVLRGNKNPAWHV